MQVAILTFEGFNEIDSFVALNLLDRLRAEGLSVWITSPGARVTSKAGVAIEAQKPLEFVREADAVIVGSGVNSAKIAADRTVLARLSLDPARQLIASQCSGALLLNALGLVGPSGVCADHVTRPALEALGVKVLDAAFHAEGHVASAGGCLAGQYLAAWVAGCAYGEAAARRIVWEAAPVGEKDAYAERALAAVRPYLKAKAAA
jgi:transcriptional regulator GlxA family with amidase domain